ncbi:copper resistance protein B [Lentisalinibacter salinarum]|uniref:copper resistance protein B n=1 Tax=Lentisalinibacter salinarum TaxID=2992239 RepID=UPI003867DD0A
MSVPDLNVIPLVLVALLVGHAGAAQPMDEVPTTEGRPDHGESAAQHADKKAPPVEEPPLPEGMSLDDVLDYSANPPPGHFPNPVPDDRTYRFTFIEQLEYRIADDDAPDRVGWEAQGWVGGDFHKFWWKSEGEAIFEGPDEGESENDFLYSRLIAPFWNFQAGMQYANEWGGSDYEDRWSAVVALQGLAPYKFELDTSLYLSEDGDLTLAAEGEYDLRITQRLVLQPRAALGISAQDVPERGLGSGLTDVKIDLRLRYEIRRELAPYLLMRYTTALGETEDIAEAAGADTSQWLFGAGLRFAF